MMRYSKSPRRSLPGFAVDMALRDMRRGKDPLFAEMLGALKQAEEILADMGLFADDEPRVTFRRVISAAEARNG